ncbi:hypothetical protein VmeM32_00068 [Vibrio phage vB_VmeM-32]|nr:hypothetical protein VmeM32_00068 [Vibrio phage vB_VmeM-32]
MSSIESPFLKFNFAKFSNAVIAFEKGEKFYRKTPDNRFLLISQVNDLADCWITSCIYVVNPDYVKPWSETVADEMKNFGVTYRTTDIGDIISIIGEFDKLEAIKLAQSIIRATKQ